MNREEANGKIKALSALCIENDGIDAELDTRHNVKRGLRDVNGKGVVTGLTDISAIISNKIVDGEEVPCRGELYYRGINVRDLAAGFQKDGRFGFEETTYLLIFGKLPNERELAEFKNVLSAYMSLPPSFVRDIIMKAPSKDMMNTLARSVLMLYAYDDAANDTSVENVLRQCLQLIAEFPLLAVYGYQTYNHYHGSKSLYIHEAKPKLSIAENTLRLLRPNKRYTETEAKLLDLALVLHAEHGGGNNSTFTTRVITSSGSDTYSVIAGALGSLKGPRHGGANLKVVGMFDELKQEVRDWEDEDEIKAYLGKLLHKEAFDRAGLIYGMGHAVYSLSDPRAEIFKDCVEKLSIEKGREKEFRLYTTVERLSPQVIAEERKIYKGVSANVDFYSGFAYSMLGLPMELYTPIFAIARISGWSAHRIEELVCASKIIRPAYKSVSTPRPYVPLKERE